MSVPQQWLATTGERLTLKISLSQNYVFCVSVLLIMSHNGTNSLKGIGDEIKVVISGFRNGIELCLVTRFDYDYGPIVNQEEFAKNVVKGEEFNFWLKRGTAFTVKLW